MLLKVALNQKDTILSVLAAQAALIFVLTSKIADEPIPKAAAIIAALTIFAAELGQLDQSLLVGRLVTVVILFPMGIAVTNSIPSPKYLLPRDTVGWLWAILLGSVAVPVGVLVVVTTDAGLFLAVVFGGELVALILTAGVSVSFILIMASVFGLLAVAHGRNTRPRR